MSRFRALVAAAAVALALVACGEDNQLTEGEVINKAYHPQETSYVMTCVAYGQYGCSSWVPMPHTDPEHWRLQVVGPHGDVSLREWHNVSEGFFNEVQVGQWADLDAEEVVPR